MPIPPAKLEFSHVGIYVHDLPKMEAFYSRILGFVATDRGIARGALIVFLSRNPEEHHQIVLAEGRVGGPESRVVNQLSLRADNLQDLRDLVDAIVDEPEVTDIDPINHGNAWSVYFRDPEGNRLEVFVDSPWHIEQPLIEPLDLSMSDDDIHDRTRAAYGGSDTFQPLEEWKAEFGKRLKAAGIHV
ncbi:MAG: VOC family protein [Rhodospirillaceae bacterium]|nr:VOC family protein [Rhodospirillaceae bacterium]MCY4237147.1 VOC family protein [Rhodospirillaceae bacterium]